MMLQTRTGQRRNTAGMPIGPCHDDQKSPWRHPGNWLALRRDMSLIV
jgi:hypothetical protein